MDVLKRPLARLFGSDLFGYMFDILFFPLAFRVLWIRDGKKLYFDAEVIGNWIDVVNNNRIYPYARNIYSCRTKFI